MVFEDQLQEDIKALIRRHCRILLSVGTIGLFEGVEDSHHRLLVIHRLESHLASLGTWHFASSDALKTRLDPGTLLRDLSRAGGSFLGPHVV